MTTQTITEQLAVSMFADYEQLLNRIRPGSYARLQGKELTKGKKDYALLCERLNPIGQWSTDKVIETLENIKTGLELPEGYTIRIDEKKQFIANNINTATNYSLWINKQGVNLDDSNQFSIEVRIFINRPGCVVWFTSGNQYAFKGKDIKVFNGSGCLTVDTYKALELAIIESVNKAILTTKPNY